MSISQNTGRFARCLVRLRSRPGYFQTKLRTGRIIKKIPLVGNRLFALIRDFKKLLKNIMYGSNYFEDLGIYYLGPADGNNEEQVETLLREAKKLGESVILHIKTKKGKGYPPAEAEPLLYQPVSGRQAGAGQDNFGRVRQNPMLSCGSQPQDCSYYRCDELRYRAEPSENISRPVLTWGLPRRMP